MSRRIAQLMRLRAKPAEFRPAVPNQQESESSAGEHEERQEEAGQIDKTNDTEQKEEEEK